MTAGSSGQFSLFAQLEYVEDLIKRRNKSRDTYYDKRYYNKLIRFVIKNSEHPEEIRRVLRKKGVHLP